MTDTPLLSVAEIVRRLRYIAASDPTARNARRAIGINTIARQAHLGRQFLYQIIANEHIPAEKAQRKLSAALKDINLSDFN